MTDLIYDIGLHRGEDSEFYLRKGFQVVAVDANPDMCEIAAERLQEFVRSGRVQIVSAAIAEQPGSVTFFRNANSEWGTIIDRWRRQNQARGSHSEAVTVEGITLADLVRRFGPAYYMKIDIEGMDVAALESLRSTDMRPKYLSIESAFPRETSFSSVRREFDALAALGYDRFKIVPQHEVPEQVPPKPARGGNYVPFSFESGASGLFGEEAPGEWMPFDRALTAFRRAMGANWPQSVLIRHMRLFVAYAKAYRSLTGRELELGWYDIHAKHCEVE